MRYSLLLLACVAIVGCSAGSDTVVNGSSSGAMFVPPHIGTWFMLETWDIDTGFNRLKITDISQRTVVETGMRYLGKSNVARLQGDSTSGPDYVNYEADGNISVWNEYLQRWVTLPVATHGSIVDSWSDTTFDGFVHKVVETYTYAGMEDVDLGSHRFHAVKITGLYKEWTGGVESIYDGPATTYWYAPEIGWYVKFVAPTFAHGQGEIIELQSCELK